MISLSIKAKDEYDEKQAMKEYGVGAAEATSSLGDILKEHIKSGEDA